MAVMAVMVWAMKCPKKFFLLILCLIFIGFVDWQALAFKARRHSRDVDCKRWRDGNDDDGINECLRILLFNEPKTEVQYILSISINQLFAD